jgi:hypothetical protein
VTEKKLNSRGPTNNEINTDDGKDSFQKFTHLGQATDNHGFCSLAIEHFRGFYESLGSVLYTVPMNNMRQRSRCRLCQCRGHREEAALRRTASPRGNDERKRLWRSAKIEHIVAESVDVFV